MTQPSGVPERMSAEDSALYASVGRLLTLGVGADRAFNLLREAGGTTTRATIRAMAGQIRTSLDIRAAVGRLNPANPVPARVVTVNDSIKRTGFLHTASILLRDTLTGFTVQKYYIYRSDTLVAPNDVYDAYLAAAGGGMGYEGFEPVAMNLIGVQQGPGL